MTPTGESKDVQGCLFCLQDTSSSLSVEHVVPESLGNTTIVLPRGIVCDRCNNYFARKVEGPFLNLPPVIAMRHIHGVENKRGRVPGLDVTLNNGAQGRFERNLKSQVPFALWLDSTLDGDPETRHNALPTRAYFPHPDSQVPTRDVARFVAKAGLEYLAHRNLGHAAGLRSVLRSSELNPCRKFARFGEGPSEWTVRIERIYEPDHLFLENLPDYQRVWEMDTLLLNDSDCAVFAMSIFGLEFAINLLAPDLSPYDSWRRLTGAPSLLYPSGVPSDLR